MKVSENDPENRKPVRAKTLNRIIAKSIDFLIIGVLLKAVPEVGYFAGMAYLLLADGLFDGRSLGKKLIKLKVIFPEKSETCSFRESVIRNFTFALGYILMEIPLIGPILAVAILLIESLIMLGSSKGMRLGDEFAKTQVVEEKTALLNGQG